MKEAIDRLWGILQWSDRLGSSEEAEIKDIIKILENEKQKQN